MDCEFPTCTRFAESNKYCIFHQVYASQPKADKEKKGLKSDPKRKQKLTIFYNSMLNKAPFKCQECPANLVGSTIINPRTIIAHILPKAHFESIECNEDNILFLCSDCHHNMDNKGKDFILKMKLLPTIKERLMILSKLITDSENRKVPEYYKQLIENKTIFKNNQ